MDKTVRFPLSIPTGKVIWINVRKTMSNIEFISDDGHKFLFTDSSVNTFARALLAFIETRENVGRDS